MELLEKSIKLFGMEPVALKKFIVEKSTELYIEMYKKEVTILHKVRHNHVLSFTGYVSKPYLEIVTQ